MRYLLNVFFIFAICSCTKDVGSTAPINVVQARKQNYWTIESMGEYGTDSVGFYTPRLIAYSEPVFTDSDSMNSYKGLSIFVHLDVNHPSGDYKLLNAASFLNNSSSVPKMPGDHEMHIVVQWKGLFYRNYDAPIITGTLFDSAGQQYLRGRQYILKQQNDRSDILKLDFLICISRSQGYYYTKDNFYIKVNNNEISQKFVTNVTLHTSNYSWSYTVDSNHSITITLPSIPYESQSLTLGRSIFEVPYLEYRVGGKSYISYGIGSSINIKNTGGNFIAEMDSAWLKNYTGDSVLLRKGHFLLK
jgi:hypothetical protein